MVISPTLYIAFLPLLNCYFKQKDLFAFVLSFLLLWTIYILNAKNSVCYFNALFYLTSSRVRIECTHNLKLLALFYFLVPHDNLHSAFLGSQRHRRRNNKGRRIILSHPIIKRKIIKLIFWKYGIIYYIEIEISDWQQFSNLVWKTLSFTGMSLYDETCRCAVV